MFMTKPLMDAHTCTPNQIYTLNMTVKPAKIRGAVKNEAEQSILDCWSQSWEVNRDYITECGARHRESVMGRQR
jgi:hypothetical protein